MKPPARFPFKRFALAVAVSLLVHILLLWQWQKFVPVSKFEPAPLQAELEALHKPAKKPVQRKPKAKVASQPQAGTQPVATVASDITTSAVAIAPAVAETFIPEALPASISRPLLPHHARLTFSVQYGNGGFKVGEVIHTLENRNGHYTLRAESQTTGLASIFKNFSLRQSSSGLVSSAGLRPLNYTEDKTDNNGQYNSAARFDWSGNKIHFANGSSKPLLEQAQDILSLSYQLAQMPLSLDSFPIALSNGRSIAQYFIAVGEETTISTAMGELRTLPLRKVQSANEDGLIIWLALEYRLLPVKIQYLDKSGEVSANMLITDIRVSDE